MRQAFDMLAPVIEKAAAREPVGATVFDPERYVGRYHDPDGWSTDVLWFEGRLVMYGHGYPPSSNPKGSLTDLTPEREHMFRMTGENGNGELVVFELRPDGRVARVKVGANYLFPEDCDRIDERLNCIWQ